MDRGNPENAMLLCFPDEDDQYECGDTSASSSLFQMWNGNECNKSSCDNLLIVVEKIMSNTDCFHVADSLGIKLQSEPQENYMGIYFTFYIDEIKWFGFSHIIIIGERHCGMLFLDCYNHVFDLDSLTHVLWFLGDYSEIMLKKSKIREPWDVLDDGTVFELEKCMYI